MAIQINDTQTMQLKKVPLSCEVMTADQITDYVNDKLTDYCKSDDTNSSPRFSGLYLDSAQVLYLGSNSLKTALDNMIDKICAAANITDSTKIAEIKAQIV